MFWIQWTHLRQAVAARLRDTDAEVRKEAVAAVAELAPGNRTQATLGPGPAVGGWPGWPETPNIPQGIGGFQSGLI